MRKLATVRKISEILPIDGADSIELVKVDGWQVVSKKGEFHQGDFCIYFEIDSFLPIKQNFEFLRKSCFKKDNTGKEGFRLKTIKLRGNISQGLVLPVSLFLEDIKSKLGYNFLGSHEDFESLYNNNVDLSEILEVSKYEIPLPANLQGKAKGNFPFFIPKTDQERIQNVWDEYKKKYNDLEFEDTLKLDGTSATFYFNENKLGVCSRNLELKFEEEDLSILTEEVVLDGPRNKNTYIYVGIRQGIFDSLKKYGKNIAIQGEIVGPGIQGNKEKFTEQRLFIYDIFDIDKKRYLTSEERFNILKDLELEKYHIRVRGNLKLCNFSTLEELLFYAEGPSINNEIREGIVLKSKELVNERVISFKVISNKFLLKYE